MRNFHRDASGGRLGLSSHSRDAMSPFSTWKTKGTTRTTSAKKKKVERSYLRDRDMTQILFDNSYSECPSPGHITRQDATKTLQFINSTPLPSHRKGEDQTPDLPEAGFHF